MDIEGELSKELTRECIDVLDQLLAEGNPRAMVVTNLFKSQTERGIRVPVVQQTK